MGANEPRRGPRWLAWIAVPLVVAAASLCLLPTPPWRWLGIAFAAIVLVWWLLPWVAKRPIGSGKRPSVTDELAAYRRLAVMELSWTSPSPAVDAKASEGQIRTLDVIDTKIRFALAVASALIAIQGFAARHLLTERESTPSVGSADFWIVAGGLGLLLFAAVAALKVGVVWLTEDNTGTSGGMNVDGWAEDRRVWIQLVP